MSQEVEGLVTPTWLTFIDKFGTEWRALALVAPLKSEDSDTIQFAETQDLGLKVKNIRVVRG